MNAFNFTNTKLRNLINTTGKDEEYKDTFQKGLILRLTRNNTKIFRLRAWNKRRKKTEQIVIGNYPSVSILVAREVVADHISNMTRGLDISEMVQSQRSEKTLNELFEVWVETYAKEKNRRWERYVNRCDLYIRPFLGKKRITDITVDTLAQWRNSKIF